MSYNSIKPLKNLIVEDSLIDRKQLERLPSRPTLPSSEIKHAEYPENTLALLNTDNFDTAIPDLNLPDCPSQKLHPGFPSWEQGSYHVDSRANKYSNCENMRSGRGFTLIELMVVILIISFLAGVVIPRIYGQESAAKWSEGRAAMGTIATAIRACCAIDVGSSTIPVNLWADEPDSLGFARNDLDGKYFEGDDFSFTVTSVLPLVFTITATKPGLFPPAYQLDQTGKWTTP
jgi:prepilin-type N-terminal cleavage/methylation domain-containing protein